MVNYWENLNPKHRRYIVVGSAVAVFAGVVAMIPAGEKEERGKKEEPAIRAVLTDRENGDVRYERLLALMENVRDENKALKKDFERVRRDMERLEVGEIGPRLNGQLAELNDKLVKLEEAQQLGVSAPAEKTAGEEGEAVVEVPATSSPDSTPVVNEPGAPSQSQEEGMWNQPAPQPQPPAEEGRGGRGAPVDPAATNQTTIRVIEAQKQETAAEADLDEESEGVYLPAGSILTGTLITGMDAPTGKGARQEPFPALLRIKHEAILPNRFRADVRECFVIVGGYGDLSSERAYLRGESISCIRNDGKVVESSMESFTVGEDGKAGLRGRLVSKQGQMLAKAMMAGVMEGFAGAFGSSPVPTLSLEPTEKQLYQQAFSSEALQSGTVSGVGKALDRLAQFYIEQADGMFPVIEVDAGREVEIVMIRGGNLALK